jgi:type I restriction enzyme S subunit
MPEPIGRACILPDLGYPAITAVDVSILRLERNCAEPDFVVQYLNSDQWYRLVLNYASGATRPRVSRKKLENFEIPLPPLSEQRRIAGTLREQMAAVERARAAARARLEAVKALPAAFLRQVFPQPAQPLPDGWRWVRLGEVAAVVSGFGFSVEWQGRRDLPYPFVKVSDMNSPGAEVVISEAANTVDEAILSALGARSYPAGTIVFPKVGGALLTNKRRILGREASFDNNIMGVVPQHADGEFVFFWFSSVDLAAHANTQALPSIRQSLVASLEIPLPPLSEQRRIAGTLREQTAAVERARAAAEAELEAVEALPAALLRRAFNGEL